MGNLWREGDIEWGGKKLGGGGGEITCKAKLYAKQHGRSMNTYFGCMVESLPTNASKSRASS